MNGRVLVRRASMAAVLLMMVDGGWGFAAVLDGPPQLPYGAPQARPEPSPMSPPPSEFDRPLTPPPVPRSLLPQEAPPSAPPDRLLESTWSARIDYFQWKERFGGADFVNESGPQTAITYTRRNGPERFRAELFGGNVTYDGGAQFDDGSVEAYSAATNYLGCRGEYDLLFQPDVWPNTLFFLGVGTRFWFRDLPDATTPSGAYVMGYQETWWTIYPYLGMELKRPLNSGPELFVMGRVGLTAVTYEQVTLNDAVLYPKPGVTGQIEVGLRGRRLALSAFCESMNWGESAVVRDTLQPESRLLLLGGRLAYRF